jgi:hypothetical protein
MSTTDLIVEKEFERRRKAVEAQRRYRQRLKEGTNKSSNLSYNQYLEGRAIYMKGYKKNKKDEFEKAFKNYDITKLQKNDEEPPEAPYKEKRTRKQVDLSIKKAMPVIKKQGNVIKKTQAQWKRGLPSNATPEQIQAAKKMTPTSINTNVKAISVVYRLVLNIPFENEVKTVITQILQGQKLSADEMRNVKKLMPMISNVDAVIKLANQVQAKYKSQQSVRTNLTPFVNVLSRLGDAYDKPYQQLTAITTKQAKNYSEERDENMVEEKDQGKIFNFNPNEVKKVIDERLTDTEDKALAACYALQAPRRLEDFQHMIITDEPVSRCNDARYNYLVLVDNIPSRFVYLKFKTAFEFGKQDFEVNADILPYLTNYLNDKRFNFLPITSKKYLFGTSKKERNKNLNNFSQPVSALFEKMYGENIGVRWIRASAATRINNRKDIQLNLRERKEYARRMAHSRATSEQYEKMLNQMLDKEEGETDE